MPIMVRPARTDPEWRQATRVMYDVYVGEGHSAAVHASQTYQREKLEPEGTVLMALNEHEEVLGALILLHPESAMGQVARSGEREFRLLAVRAGDRRQGVGEALVRGCIDRCLHEEAEALVLWTRPMMTAAQRLYERLGFHRAKARDEEDPRGFLRMVYRRELGAVPAKG